MFRPLSSLLFHVIFKTSPKTCQKRVSHLSHAKSIVFQNNKCESSEPNCLPEVVLPTFQKLRCFARWTLSLVIFLFKVSGFSNDPIFSPEVLFLDWNTQPLIVKWIAHSGSICFSLCASFEKSPLIGSNCPSMWVLHCGSLPKRWWIKLLDSF